MFNTIFGLLGGLALFIYGMQCMSDGLQKLAGNRLRKIFNVITKIPVVGVLIGTAITGVVQSSSLTTVMAVGFVNANLMTLKQAVAVVLGANIGTTVTAQLVAFKITDYWSVLVAVGFIFYFFFKMKKVKNTGYIFFALGILLLGMVLMSDAVYPLRSNETFVNAIAFFSQYKILGLLAGMVFTAIVQSSSATIGLLIAMASAGIIPLDAALPILLGSNIGTCITAVLAAIGTSVAAKRVAVAHVLFNIFGALLFMFILPIFQDFIVMLFPSGIERQIAMAHTFFNIIVTIPAVILINQFVKLVEKLVPEKEQTISKMVKYLDYNFIDSPEFSMDLVRKELTNMGEISKEALQLAMEALFERNEDKITKVQEKEAIVDELEIEISRYLSKMSQSNLSEEMSVTHTCFLHAANDIERISDHAMNIAYQVRDMIQKNLSYSDIANEGLKEMYDLASKSFSTAMEALAADDAERANIVYEEEDQIDALEQKLRNGHMQRLSQGQCTPESGVLYLEIISNLERVGDHATNLAEVAQGRIE